jgi:serine/threonine-protein kinase RsbW
MTHQEAVEVPIALTALPQVREAVERALTRGGFPSHHLNRLQLAIEEAVTNIIEHGYDGRQPPQARILMRLDITPERFRAEIIDEGSGFDPRNADPVDIRAHVAAGRAGGLGVFLMRRIMDVVDYQYETGRHNRLTLIKHSR